MIPGQITDIETAKNVKVVNFDDLIYSATSNPTGGISLVRKDDTVQVTIANGANLSGIFSLVGFAGMSLHMPPTWTAACVGLYVSAEGSSFQPFYDADNANTPIQIGTSTTKPTAGKAYTFPADLYPWRYAMLWSQDGTGTNVAQAGDKVFRLSLKS